MTVFIACAMIIAAYVVYRLVSAAHARRVLRDRREAEEYRSFQGYDEPLKPRRHSTWNDGDQP